MKEKVIDILFESFYTNAASIEVVKQDDKKDKRFRLLLEYSYFLTQENGKIYLSEDEKACALILDTNNKKISLRFIWWQIILVFKVIGIFNIKKVLKRLKTLNKAKPKESHIYIWYIGVKINEQGKGYGTALMKEILVDYSNRIICLETTQQQNIPFYQKLGFAKIKEVEAMEYIFSIFRLFPKDSFKN